MHILFIPKWYPGRKDPQLGDFLRKQAIAVGGKARVSVLHVSPYRDLEAPEVQEVEENDGIWELKCLYHGSSLGNYTLRRMVNLPLYWRAAMNGFKRVVKERGMPDISHVHIMVRPAMLALALRRKHGIPFVISEQSSEYLDGAFASKGPFFKAWSRYLFAKASAVTAVSKWLGDALIGHGLITHYDVVPNVIPGLDRPLPPAGDPHHFMVRPAMLALALRRKHGIPFVISEQSSEYLDGAFASKGPVFKAWNRYLFAQASAVTAVSKWLGDALIGHGLITHCDVVPNVIPGLDRPLPPAGDPHHFMVVADLVDKTKNVSGVIKALSKASEVDPALRLSIIGDGPDRRMLEELVTTQGLNGSVKFLGRLSNTEVLDHMAHTGSVIINSNVETFSVVTGEALALGKPVIATRCGGPIAFVTPENGILIDPKDEKTLTEAMLEIARTTEKRSPMIIRNSVNKRFSYDAVASAFMNIYERVLKHGS